MRLLALALTALALVGCESTQEQSAKLEKLAKREAAASARHKAPSARARSITRPSTIVKVLDAVVLHSTEGAAVAVTLRNDSASSLRDVPIQIVVKDRHGTTLYTNSTPGLATTLVSVPILGAHATANWVDDQVQTSATPASVSVKVGEGERVAGTGPRIAVVGAHLSEGEAEGSIVNHSRGTQEEVVVYAVARRGATIVAAGRAIVPTAAPGATERFQAFLIGASSGAQLQVSAVPTILG